MSCAASDITACRSCGSKDLRPVLDLGEQALSDFVASTEVARLERAPLRLVACDDCLLVQLDHTVPRDRLFRRYWYRSATNETMVEALRDVVRHALRVGRVQPDDLVADIGANDGTLLSLYPAEYWRRLAFEPALNLISRIDPKVLTIPSYFPPPPVLEWRAKVITSIAMFYSVLDPVSFVGAIRKHLADDGAWIVQMAMLEDMLCRNAFDNICHEHLAYWSVESFLALLGRHRLQVTECEVNNVNGGSWRFTVEHGCWRKWPQARLINEGLPEWVLGLERLKVETIALLNDLKRQGATVWGYGASTKGNTLLQFYGIGPELLDAIADRNPDKWGLCTPTGIPVVSEEYMRGQRPDYLLALPWHFLEAFKRRERPYLETGGKFIRPLPRLRIEGREEAEHADVSAQEPAPAPRARLSA